MVKAIVCDIDNTLVATHQDMSKATKNIISKLKNNNILFGIASGRQYVQVKKLIKSWNIDVDFVIGANGCELIDIKRKEEYSYFMMMPEWFKEIMGLMRPFGANPIMVKNDELIVERIDENVLASNQYLKSKIKVIDNYENYYTVGPKIMFRIDEDKVPACEEFLSKHPSKYYKGFKTQPSMIEFTNINASKAYALEQYCSNNKINIDDVWAFGDTSNDNEMLEVAGRGICMLNGSDDTKTIADYITEKTCKDDGLSYYLEKHLFRTK